MVSTRSRSVRSDVDTDVSASLISSLSADGFYINIYLNSDKVALNGTVHEYDNRELYVPHGCSILFNQNIAHSGAKSRKLRGEYAEDLRLFQYVVHRNGSKPTLNETNKLNPCRSCDKCKDYIANNNEAATPPNETKLKQHSLIASSGEAIEGSYEGTGYVIFRSHKYRYYKSGYGDLLFNRTHSQAQDIQRSTDVTSGKRMELKLSECPCRQTKAVITDILDDLKRSVRKACDNTPNDDFWDNHSFQHPSVIFNQGEMIQQQCHRDYK